MVTGEDKLSAQVAVLGSLLIEPKLVGEAVTKIRDEDFLTPKYRMVWQAIRALFLGGKPIDAALVRNQLGGRPEDGWTQLLLELMELTPTAANIWTYVSLMREQARRTRAAELGALIQAHDSEEQLREYIAQLNDLLVERRGVDRMDMSQMILTFTDRHSGEPVKYMTWGLPKIDAGTYVELGDMVVLGGYPSAGKTALAVSMAYHQAKHFRVGFYSLETNRFKLADRLVSNNVGIEMSAIKGNKITEDEWQRVADQSDRIRARQLEIVEASGMTVQDIQSDALARRYEIVYVDYLQLIEPESRRMNRTEQVSGISRGLQQFAHEHGRMVVALSQLSRPEQSSKNEQIEPTMSDLRESGQIEQDADAIMLLYLEDPSRPDESRRVLKVAKNKEGTRGRIYLVFDGQYQRFRESAVDEPAPQRNIARRASKSSQMTWEDLSEKLDAEEAARVFEQGQE